MVSAVVSFDAHDPTYFYDSSGDTAHTISNYTGIIGAYVASTLLYFAGCSIFLLFPLLLLTILLLVRVCSLKQEWSRLVGLALVFVASAMLAYQLGAEFFIGIIPGGLVGGWCSGMLFGLSDGFIAYVSSLAMLYVGTILIIRFAWLQPIARCFVAVAVFFRVPDVCRLGFRTFNTGLCKVKNFVVRKKQSAPLDSLEWLVQETVRSEQIDTVDDESEDIFEDPFWQQYSLSRESQEACELQGTSESVRDLPKSQDEFIEDVSLGDAQHSSVKRYVVPDKKVFTSSGPHEDESSRQKVAQERAHNLAAKLEMFGIKGQVMAITIGPVVTLFEYAPASDVKVSKILALEDDLALALEALSLRIIAPIPGRPVVGFEVANIHRDIVYFADSITSKAYAQHDGALPLIIGRDTVGKEIVVDLAAMPHLLVAGSTGAGKSVALNAMLTSLLCRCSPDELNMILIDPKRLEFAPFADVAHLVFPIVTDVQRVPLVLRWAVAMMEERYTELARAGVRNVQEYQEKFGIAAMPYMVIVIDELADLMMTVGKDVEELIARLAQMARASGIHMIVATQRPSVDVITGLIKVNFPSRIAFKVTSKIDSRTILDCSGAEKLLGRGDMLFLNQKGMLSRVHGAYVKDSEINAVVQHIKRQRTVKYQELDLFAQKVAEDAIIEDDLYHEVVVFVESLDQVSISLLQRTFRIGYNRSARLIDTLEAHGVIMPADGGKMRKVLR
jgi:DNA segregation ATPase FtsK/SpoIIIE-like protein